MPSSSNWGKTTGGKARFWTSVNPSRSASMSLHISGVPASAPHPHPHRHQRRAPSSSPPSGPPRRPAAGGAARPELRFECSDLPRRLRRRQLVLRVPRDGGGRRRPVDQPVGLHVPRLLRRDRSAARHGLPPRSGGRLCGKVHVLGWRDDARHMDRVRRSLIHTKTR